MNKIQIILVLYGKKLEQSKTFVSFEKNKKNLKAEYNLLIYNNDSSIKIPQPFDYKSEINDNKQSIFIYPKNEYQVINSATNDKLQIPYSFALKKAVETGCKWLLLLDDDTELTAEYFLELSEKIESACGAIVPRCFYKNKQLSPCIYNPKIRNYLFFKPTKPCITTKCLSAFNSGAMFSVEILQRIGGFSESFEMDFLDNLTFYKLYCSGVEVEILNAKLQHNLSLLNYKTLSVTRYTSILQAEKKFTAILGKKAQLNYSIWLFLRFVKQLIVPAKRRFAKITLKNIL